METGFRPELPGKFNDLKSESIGHTSIAVTITPGAPMTELDAIREATAYRVLCIANAGVAAYGV